MGVILLYRGLTRPDTDQVCLDIDDLTVILWVYMKTAWNMFTESLSPNKAWKEWGNIGVLSQGDGLFH